MLAWGIGLFHFALAFGSLASLLTDFVADMPTVGELAPIDLEYLTGNFSAYVLMMLAAGPLALMVFAVLRMRSEELAGRLAGVLQAGTSRVRLALTWSLVALVQAAAIQVLLGLGVWSATEDAAWIPHMNLADLAYLSAIALTGSLALMLYGLSVRLAPLAWPVVGWTALVTFRGEALGLPEGARDLSSLQQVGPVPSKDPGGVALLPMGAAAAALLVLGLLALRRRDLAAG